MNLTEFFRKQRIVYLSMVLAPLIFAIAMYATAIPPDESNIFQEYSGWLMYILPVVVAITGYIALSRRNVKLAALNEMQDPKKVLESYGSIQIIAYATIEFSAYLCIILYRISNNTTLLAGVIIAILYFIPLYPKSANLPDTFHNGETN